MKRIYISGKISGLTENEYMYNFSEAASNLRYMHKDAEIVNPTYIKPLFGFKTWLCFMISDIYQQSKCTHTAFQSNFLESKGATIEYLFAKFIFKHEIIFLNDL